MPKNRFQSTTLVVLWCICVASVSAQVPPSANDIAGYDGLHRAAHDNDTESIKSLGVDDTALGTRDSAGRTPLMIAVYASNDEAVRALAKAGSDMNALESQAYDVVTIAAVANDISMLSLVLALGASAKNVTSPYEGTALIAAAHLGHHKVVDILIKADAPLDHVNNLQWTAVIEAVILGDGASNHEATLKHLLDAGADRSIPDGDGITPLEHAKRRSYSRLVALLENE